MHHFKIFSKKGLALYLDDINIAINVPYPFFEL